MLKRSHPTWGWGSISVVDQPYFSLFPACETGCGIDTSIMYQHFCTISSKTVAWSLLNSIMNKKCVYVCTNRWLWWPMGLSPSCFCTCAVGVNYNVCGLQTEQSVSLSVARLSLNVLGSDSDQGACCQCYSYCNVDMVGLFSCRSIH